MTIRVFISYSEADRRKVEILNQYFAPHKHYEIVIVPFKKAEMIPSATKVIQGIKSAQIFIPVLTTKSMQTQWINQEIGYAKALEPSLTILPIVERQIIDTLKGFIHKELNISFTFLADAKPKTENVRFARTVKALIEFLDERHRPSPSRTDHQKTVPLSQFIIGRIFNFTFNPKTKASKHMRFEADGTIAIGRNQNEDTWTVEGDSLEIYNAKGQLQSKFRYFPKENILRHTNDPAALSLRDQYLIPWA